MILEYKILPMKKQNITEVIQFWKSIDGIFLQETGEDSEESISLYLERNPDFSFIAVNSQNQIIAAVLCGHDGRVGFFHHLGVNKNYRNKGIANKLIDTSMEKLKISGIKKAALFVLKDRKEAQEFYQHNKWNKVDIVYIYSKII